MAGMPSACAQSRRKFAFFWLLSTRCTSAPGVSASAQAITRPGKPAPEPRSIQRVAPGTSGEELERIGDVAGPDLRQRRAAPRDWCAAARWSSALDEAVEPRPRFT